MVNLNQQPARRERDQSAGIASGGTAPRPTVPDPPRGKHEHGTETTADWGCGGHRPDE